MTECGRIIVRLIVTCVRCFCYWRKIRLLRTSRAVHRRLPSAAGSLKATSWASRSGHLGQKYTCVYTYPSLRQDGRRLYRANGLLSRINIYKSGNLGWPTCGSSVTRRDISKNAQNSTEDTNSNPNPYPDPDSVPTHVNFVRKE